MKVRAYQTPVIHIHDDFFAVLEAALPATLPENTVLAITSKIIALCEGAVAERTLATKEEKYALVQQEADAYIAPTASKYGVILTIKDHVLAVSAGIDESNADGAYVLLPRDSYAVAEKVWHWMREKYQLKHCGVIVTDSRTIPLKWGTIGTCLAHCGFSALTNRIGENDLFGHTMQMTQVNVAEALAVSAVLLMGEVAESTPLATITDAPQIVYQDHPPSAVEKEALVIAPEDDVYGPIITAADWKKKDTDVKK